MPAPRKIALSDTELLALREAGHSQRDIASLAGVGREAIRQRLKTIAANLPAPAARRAEETLTLTLSAIKELRRNYDTLNAVKEACLALLTDEQGGLWLGTHDFDLEVMVSQHGQPPHRVKLTDLLQQSEGSFVLSVDSKHADPRTLLLATLQQIRQHVELGVKLTERIHDAERIEEFIRSVLEEIGRESDACRTRIEERLLAQRALRLALLAPAERNLP